MFKTYDQHLLETIQNQIIMIQAFLLKSEMHRTGLISDQDYRDCLIGVHEKFNDIMVSVTNNEKEGSTNA